MENIKKTYIPILKGILMVLIITLVAILIFAGIISATDMSEGAVHFVNQIIKAAAIFAGCFYSLKSGNAFLKGLIVGLAALFCSYIIFSILEGRAIFSLNLLYEMLFGAICGAICGIIIGFIKKKS